jgi:hypothetical protein
MPLPTSVTGVGTAEENPRAWTFARRKAIGLYQIQNNRFQGFANVDRANEYISLIKIHTMMGGTQEAKPIMEELVRAIKNLDENDLPTLESMWQNLAEAKEAGEFAKIIADTISSKDAGDTSGVDSDAIEEEKPVKVTLVQRLTTLLSNAKTQLKYINPKQAFQELFPIVERFAGAGISFATWNAIRRGASFGLDRLMITEQTIPCVMLGMPIPHVQEIEVARSGKILKFRATGSVFLANQEGGLDAVRIEGYFFRSEILWILALLGLFSYGSGTTKDVPQLLDAEDTINLKKLRKIGDVTRFNRKTEVPSYEYHRTFPIVTRHIIMPNCYIETLSFEEKLVFGKDCVGFTILLRTYKEPKEFDLYKKSSTTAYFAPALSKYTKMGSVLEAVLNMAWRGIMASGIIIKEREWKLEGETAQNLDVTYDIDAEQIAITTLFGLAGVMGNYIPTLL